MLEAGWVIMLENEPELFKEPLGLKAVAIELVTTMRLTPPFAAWRITFKVPSIAPSIP